MSSVGNGEENMIKYLYQLPQNLLGLILIVLFRGKKLQDYNDKKVYLVKGYFIISLGDYILISKRWYNSWDVYSPWVDRFLAHEYGHCRQSEILGPLYLIIVGIPSFIFNQISQHNRKFAVNYYNRFPENWADKLGKVERKSL
jgi:hypothetical protein